MEVAESLGNKIIEVNENGGAEWSAKSPFKNSEVNESDNELNTESLTSADNANENSECQCESNETDKEKNDSCENDKAELTDDIDFIDDETDFIDDENDFIDDELEYIDDETDSPFDMSENLFNMGDSSSFNLLSPLTKVTFSELDKYAVNLNECFDSNSVKAVDLSVDEFKNAVRIAVAIVANSCEIKDALLKQLSNIDKEISTLVHACEFSDNVDTKLKIKFFDELHKLRVKRREIKCKTDIINSVCTNLNNVCKRFKPSVLSAIDKWYEKYEPDTNNELVKELLGSNSNMVSEVKAVNE